MSFGYDSGASEWESAVVAVSIEPVRPSDPRGRVDEILLNP
jgi:hypothetical protein